MRWRVYEAVVAAGYALRVLAGRDGAGFRAAAQRWGRGARPGDGEGAQTLWFHGASVGEVRSALGVARRAQAAGLEVVFTVQSRTGYELLADRGLRVWFAPIDVAAAWRAFFATWRPVGGVVIESELWPRMLQTAGAARVPLVLLNARVSPRSTARWLRWLPGLAADLVGRFETVLPQSQSDHERLSALAGPHAGRVVSQPTGNLKLAQRPEPPRQFPSFGEGRPRWMALSIHAGEEAAVVDAHELLARRYPGLLTVVAPRHPQKLTGRIEAMCAARGLRVVRRTQAGAAVAADADVCVIDTLGEMTGALEQCAVVFVGGSLVAGVGGHNIAEAALHRCVVLHGREMSNFVDMAKALGHVAIEVGGPQALGAAVGRVLAMEGAAQDALAGATLAAAEDLGRGAEERAWARIATVLAGNPLRLCMMKKTAR